MILSLSFRALAVALSLVTLSCKKESVEGSVEPTQPVQSSINASARLATENLLMGNPSGAVTSTASPTNYLMQKTCYSLSYNRDRGTPNWVSWHLDPTWLGSAQRCDCFAADATLPSGWYRVGSSSYQFRV